MSDEKVRPSTPPYSPPNDDGESRPLPKGWVKQFDKKSDAWFYVDTEASPPRSIWVHPYDDPQYIASHPDIKDNAQQYLPPSSPPPVPSGSRPNSKKEGDSLVQKAQPKPNLLRRLKDKAIGTKEEREAAKRLREEEARERHALQQARYAAPAQVYQQNPYPGQPQAYGPGPYAPGQTVYVEQPQRSRGGMGMPLLGGLAGGLLLGSMLGGDGGDFGGDFGGGDFGGGDF